MLSELVRLMSRRKTSQTTLSGDILEEEKFHVLGFVPADVLSFKRKVWFSKLVAAQITDVEEYLSKRGSCDF